MIYILIGRFLKKQRIKRGYYFRTAPEIEMTKKGKEELRQKADRCMDLLRKLPDIPSQPRHQVGK